MNLPRNHDFAKVTKISISAVKWGARFANQITTCASESPPDKLYKAITLALWAETPVQYILTSGFLYYINKTLGTSSTPEVLLFIPNNFFYSAIEILKATTAAAAPGDLECYFGWQILSVLLVIKFMGIFPETIGHFQLMFIRVMPDLQHVWIGSIFIHVNGPTLT